MSSDFSHFISFVFRPRAAARIGCCAILAEALTVRVFCRGMGGRAAREDVEGGGPVIQRLTVQRAAGPEGNKLRFAVLAKILAFVS